MRTEKELERIYNQSEADGKVVLGSCILDVEHRTLTDPMQSSTVYSIEEYEVEPNDGRLLNILAGEFSFKKLEVHEKGSNRRDILAYGKVIVNLEGRNIIGLNLATTEYIGADFMQDNNTLRILKAHNLQDVGDYFLRHNKVLEVFEEH